MRIIKLKDNPNIRDIGGVYKDVTIKEGMLIRGRTLRHLTEEQSAYLVKKCNIKTIIDLRSHDEQKEAPELTISGTNYELMPIFERQKDGISHKENEKPDQFQIYRILPHMKNIYLDMLHGESLKNIGLVINRIITGKDDEYGFYFHCSEGKDRTGIIAAILLSILGVSRKEIVDEYLVTNKMSNKKAFKYYMQIKYLRLQPRFALKVGRAFLAKKIYINSLFEVIDNEYGSLDEFLYKGLNLKKENIEAFKEKLIIK
ncbi:MAG: tyrosine-protein phosphatase [Bacilli bacterium]|nr:tyrosine-protein phosphatase [Bacilli bacterium]